MNYPDNKYVGHKYKNVYNNNKITVLLDYYPELLAQSTLLIFTVSDSFGPVVVGTGDS